METTSYFTVGGTTSLAWLVVTRLFKTQDRLRKLEHNMWLLQQQNASQAIEIAELRGRVTALKEMLTQERNEKNDLRVQLQAAILQRDEALAKLVPHTMAVAPQ